MSARGTPRWSSLILAALLLAVVCCSESQQPGDARPSEADHRTVGLLEDKADTAPSLFEAAAALREDELLKQVPAPGEYVAFSLRQAERIARQHAASTAFRREHRTVVALAGINKILGTVFDAETNDLILVGHHVPTRQPLTIDDLAVALRSRFVHLEWPLVSLDAEADVLGSRTQKVRFEGGIKDTQFGADLLDADFRLKRISMGLIEAGVEDITSRWDSTVRLLQQGRVEPGTQVLSRFWFYAILPTLRIRGNVASIGGLQVGVFTEVMHAKVGDRLASNGFVDHPSEEFASAVTAHFSELAVRHQSFSRLQGLLELVAFAKAVEELRQSPDIGYWLGEYPVKKIDLPKRLQVLRREEIVPFQHNGRHLEGPMVLAGGIELRAIALRITAGDVTALRTAVLKTRPRADALTWKFIVDGWIIPTSEGSVESADFVQLLAHASYLHRQQQFEAAQELYGRLLELAPNFAPVHSDLGALLEAAGDLDGALRALDKAIECDNVFAEAYANRATVLAHKGEFERALADHNKAIALKPQLAKCYVDRGATYLNLGRYDRAIADFSTALEINPFIYQSLHNRGVAWARGKGEHESAVQDFTRAIEINPTFDAAYSNRAISYSQLGKHGEAVRDFTSAIQINPQDPRSYYGRALEQAGLGNESEAFADFRRAITMGMGEPFAHEAFQVILPSGWQMMRNPEQGLDVGASSEELPGAFWQLAYQVMPASAGDPPSNPRELRGMEQQFDRGARQNLVRPKRADTDPYKAPGRTLFDLAYTHMEDGQEQFIQFIYSFKDGVVYVFRVGYPVASAAPSKLAIDSIFHTFVPSPGLKTRSLTRVAAIESMQASLRGYVQSLPTAWRADLISVEIDENSRLVVGLAFQASTIERTFASARSAVSRLGHSSPDVAAFVYHIGQALGVAYADGARTEPAIATFAVAVHDMNENKLGTISLTAADLLRIISGDLSGDEALRTYIFR